MPIVEHPNFHAAPWPRPSDYPAMYEANLRVRQAVTVDWFLRHGVEHDLTGWYFIESEYGAGLDPWRLIDGVDSNRDFTEFYIDFPSHGRSRTLRPNDIVFVQVRDLDRAIPDWREAQEHQ